MDTNDKLLVQIKRELELTRKIQKVLEENGLYDEFLELNTEYGYKFEW